LSGKQASGSYAASGANSDITSMSGVKTISSAETYTASITISGVITTYALQTSTGINVVAGGLYYNGTQGTTLSPSASQVIAGQTCVGGICTGGTLITPSVSGGNVSNSGTPVVRSLAQWQSATAISSSPIIVDSATSLTVVGATVTASGVNFGAWSVGVAYSTGTIYQATTDGFVVANCVIDADTYRTYLNGNTDSTSGATTVRMYASCSSYHAGNVYVPANSFTMPVRKGDYWQVVYNATYGTSTNQVFWLPK